MYKNFLKRLFDLIISAIGIVVLAPFMIIFAAAVYIDDPGKIFFTQKRVGIKRGGELTYFPILKFRSMKMSTPKDVPTHLLENPESYITRVGGFLRKTSLDEIPQIFNIFMGHMAIVGPRPALWNQFDLIEAREAAGANDIRPGLTGWAQINGRDELEISEKVAYDAEYVEKLSLGFDIRCFLGTFIKVLRSEGVSEGGPKNNQIKAAMAKLRNQEDAGEGFKKRPLNIMITGSTGYIGSNLKLRLAEEPENYRVFPINLRNEAWKSVDFSGIDAIVHCAGLAHRKESEENAHEYYEVNRDLTLELAKKAKADGVAQFVFLSSLSVYGMDEGVITKETLPAPKTAYGRSKFEAELGLAELVCPEFKVCVLRPPMVYGPACPGNYTALKELVLKLSVFPKVNNRRSAISIENLCEFIVSVLANSPVGDAAHTVPAGIFVPQNPEYANTTEMAREIAEENGKTIKFSRLLGLGVILMKPFVPKARKAFGSLYYKE